MQYIPSRVYSPTFVYRSSWRKVKLHGNLRATENKILIFIDLHINPVFGEE